MLFLTPQECVRCSSHDLWPFHFIPSSKLFGFLWRCWRYSKNCEYYLKVKGQIFLGHGNGLSKHCWSSSICMDWYSSIDSYSCLFPNLSYYRLKGFYQKNVVHHCLVEVWYLLILMLLVANGDHFTNLNGLLYTDK